MEKKRKISLKKANENSEDARSNDFHLTWIETSSVMLLEQHDRIRFQRGKIGQEFLEKH